MPSGAGYLAEGDVALARAAARLTDRPTLVLGGHTHTVLNASGFTPDTLIEGVPILQAGGQGSHFGEFVASLRRGSTRQFWTISAGLHRLGTAARGPQQSDAVTLLPPDLDFDAAVLAPLNDRVRVRIGEPLARIEWSDALSRQSTLRDRYVGECALANYICDALVARSETFSTQRADLAIVNATAIADGLPHREMLTFRDWYRVQPFADTLRVAHLTGSDLLDILASNALRILRIAELSGQQAIDPTGYLARGFVHFSRSVRYTIELGHAAADSTVIDATFDGEALASRPERKLSVVFTNYLGAGGYAESWNGSPIGGVPSFSRGYDLRKLSQRETGLVFRNEGMAHLRVEGRIGPGQGARLDGRLKVG